MNLNNQNIYIPSWLFGWTQKHVFSSYELTSVHIHIKRTHVENATCPCHVCSEDIKLKLQRVTWNLSTEHIVIQICVLSSSKPVIWDVSVFAQLFRLVFDQWLSCTLSNEKCCKRKRLIWTDSVKSVTYTGTCSRSNVILQANSSNWYPLPNRFCRLTEVKKFRERCMCTVHIWFKYITFHIPFLEILLKSSETALNYVSH